MGLEMMRTGINKDTLHEMINQVYEKNIWLEPVEIHCSKQAAEDIYAMSDGEVFDLFKSEIISLDDLEERTMFKKFKDWMSDDTLLTIPNVLVAFGYLVAFGLILSAVTGNA